jgi:hypothetical protein
MPQRPTAATSTPSYRDFPARRWLVSLLRMAHLIGMVGVGAGLLVAVPVAGFDGFVIMLVASGVAMLALDFWANPHYSREAAGIAVLAKLCLLLWYVLDAAQRPWLFWVILAVSTLAAHAPARLRHRRILGRAKGK